MAKKYKRTDNEFHHMIEEWIHTQTYQCLKSASNNIYLPINHSRDVSEPVLRFSITISGLLCMLLLHIGVVQLLLIVKFARSQKRHIETKTCSIKFTVHWIPVCLDRCTALTSSCSKSSPQWSLTALWGILTLIVKMQLLLTRAFFCSYTQLTLFVLL